MWRTIKKASQVAGTTSELFKDIKVSIDFENIAELRELLQKATDQLEQLEKNSKRNQSI